MDKKIKIAVLGVGHLGKIHLQCLKDTAFEICGFYDPNPEASASVSTTHQLKSYIDLDTVLSEADAIVIASPTTSHYELARKCLESGKHLFIEKPVTEEIHEAMELQLLMQAKETVVQIGHVERFNPAYEILAANTHAPLFIEGHRLAMFNPRGTDVSVVLDLMIHDLDIVLSLVKSDIKDIKANGVRIVSKHVDICNVRLEFENGCVANLTASRISLKNMRKIRVFEKDAYINADFLNKKTMIVKLEDADDKENNGNEMTIDTWQGKKKIVIETPEIEINNAIKAELRAFHHSIINKISPAVGIQDGIKALIVAKKIEEIIRSQVDRFQVDTQWTDDIRSDFKNFPG